MLMKRNETRKSTRDALAAVPTLTEKEARTVTGGGCYNVYYNVATGEVILVKPGDVYVGPGLLIP